MFQFDIVPKAYAACTPSANGINLSDCFVLNDSGETVSSIYSNPAVLVKLFTDNVFIMAGIIIFFLFIYAGYQAISGGTKGLEESKKVITTAVIGLIVMFAAFWILQIVKVLTGADILI
jgi:hypothetical protein